MQGLQTLALGVLPRNNTTWPGAEMQLTRRPWPQEMSRLKQLRGLTLSNVDWEYARHGLPQLSQVPCRPCACEIVDGCGAAVLLHCNDLRTGNRPEAAAWHTAQAQLAPC